MEWLSMRGNLLILISTLLLAGGNLYAQNVGSLQGSVVDPTGSNVVGATVQLTDLANNATRTTKTDAAGAFSFAQLNPGTYKLEVSKDGFKTHVEERVNILVATSAREDIRLELGVMTQQVLVESV